MKLFAIWKCFVHVFCVVWYFVLLWLLPVLSDVISLFRYSKYNTLYLVKYVILNINILPFLSLPFNSLNAWLCCCFLVAQSCPTLWPRGLQPARLPCPSPPPGACSNLCPLSWWCHPTISSSFVPFSSCLQSFPAPGSFLMSRLFASGGQSIDASASVLPMNIQDWFPLGLTGLSPLQSKGLSRVFSNSTVLKHQFFRAQLSLWSNSHMPMWLLEKTKAFTVRTFVSKAICCLCLS